LDLRVSTHFHEIVAANFIVVNDCFEKLWRGEAQLCEVEHPGRDVVPDVVRLYHLLFNELYVRKTLKHDRHGR
jgi:hypothetical protein